jgi:hypothetical protein
MWLTVCLFCVVSWLSDTWHSCWSMQECEPLLVEILGHPCLRECCNVSPFLPMILPFMQVFFYHPGEWWFVKISRNSKFAGTKYWSIIFHFWNVLNKATNPMLWQVGFGHLGLPEKLHLVVALLFDHGESFFALIWVLLGRQQWWRWAATKWNFLGPFIPRLEPQFQLCSKAESPLFNHASRGF